MWFKQEDNNSELSEDSEEARHLPPGMAQEVVTRWMDCGCLGKSYPSDEQDVNTLISLLADNHAYFSGSYWRDYLFHVCNRHPIAGIFACHPFHSFSKVERLTLELLRVIGTVSWVTLMKSKMAVDDWLERSYGESRSHSVVERFIQIYLHVTLPVTVVMAGLQWLAVQTGRPESMLERWIGRDCAKCLQWWLMCFCCRFVAVLFLITMGLVANPSSYNKNEQSYEVAWRSIFQAYGLWFIKDNIMPTFNFSHPFEIGFYQKWQRQEREAQKREASVSSGDSSEEGFFSAAGWRARLGF